VPLPRTALDPDISSLNLEPVSYLVAREQTWSLQRIDEIELEYRAYLQIVRDQPDQSIVPSRDCDTYWHAHILILDLYLDQCSKLFGKPLSHYPFSGCFGEADAAQQNARFSQSQQRVTDLIRRLGSNPPTLHPSGDINEPTDTALSHSR
jgi:hypothetical protein